MRALAYRLVDYNVSDPTKIGVKVSKVYALQQKSAPRSFKTDMKTKQCTDVYEANVVSWGK